MLLLSPSMEWRGERRVVGVLKIEPSASLGLINCKFEEWGDDVNFSAEH